MVNCCVGLVFCVILCGILFWRIGVGIFFFGNSLDVIFVVLSKLVVMIEFDFDGNILIVNENFCCVFGYEFVEIKGKYYCMFVDFVESVSLDYVVFWVDLKCG